MIDICKFCDGKCYKDETQTVCDKCSVRYLDSPYMNSTQAYILNDKVYYSVVCNINENKTFVWFENIGKEPKQNIQISNLYLDTNPKDALELAKRLHKLHLFS